MSAEIAAPVSSGIGGALAGGAGALLGTGLAGWFNRREARDQRRWQRNLANTAYRRAARDLEKAGLNRVLALASPAATPSGAQASISAPSLAEAGIDAATAMQSIRQSRAEEQLKKEQAQLTRIEQKRADAEASLAQVQKAWAQAVEPEVLKMLQEAPAAISSAKQSVSDTLDSLKNLSSSSAKAAKGKYRQAVDSLSDIFTDIHNWYQKRKK